MRSAERQKRARHADEDGKQPKYRSKREQDTEHNSEDEFSSAFHGVLRSEVRSPCGHFPPNGGKFLPVPAPACSDTIPDLSRHTLQMPSRSGPSGRGIPVGIAW